MRLSPMPTGPDPRRPSRGSIVAQNECSRSHLLPPGAQRMDKMQHRLACNQPSWEQRRVNREPPRHRDPTHCVAINFAQLVATGKGDLRPVGSDSVEDHDSATLTFWHQPLTHGKTALPKFEFGRWHATRRRTLPRLTLVHQPCPHAPHSGPLIRPIEHGFANGSWWLKAEFALRQQCWLGTQRADSAVNAVSTISHRQRNRPEHGRRKDAGSCHSTAVERH